MQTAIRIRLDEHDNQLIRDIGLAQQYARSMASDQQSKALSAIQHDWFEAGKIDQGIAGLDAAIAKYRDWIESHNKFAAIPNQAAASVKVVNSISIEHERCLAHLQAVRGQLLALRDTAISYAAVRIKYGKFNV